MADCITPMYVCTQYVIRWCRLFSPNHRQAPTNDEQCDASEVIQEAGYVVCQVVHCNIHYLYSCWHGEDMMSAWLADVASYVYVALFLQAKGADEQPAGRLGRC